MRIKTKLRLGTGFLFLVIVVFGIVSLVTINRLQKDASQILQNNFESLIYASNMMEALDKLPDTSVIRTFDVNLRKQQSNVTEYGEQEATALVARQFELLKGHALSDTVKVPVRRSLLNIIVLNQQAILRKNQTAAHTAENARAWLTFIFTALILLTFTLSLNFPGVITGPVSKLTDGIRSIVNKDYSKRIHLDQRDEFGELASAFNGMAEKLDEFEHSNLAQIKFEKSRIETIINQMTDGIIGLDEKNNILFLNAVAQKLLGVQELEVLGKYAPDLALSNDLMRYILQEKQPQKEMKIFADNKESYFQLDVLAVTTNQQVIGQVIVLRNITAFHELSEAKTNFIATVSHELKTPIAAIKISTQLLTDQRVGLLTSEQTELVTSINDDANRLLKITTELINMSQAETGQIQLHVESVACRDIVAEAVHSVQYILQQKSITLNQRLSENIASVKADKEKTSWVLINFLTNAIKHSLPASEIVLSVEQNKDHIQFKVKDFGKGMDEKYLSRIFDRYYRIPGAPAGTGSGLGLTISKEFIEAQNGRVWVESMLGVGSTFGFDLPVA